MNDIIRQDASVSVSLMEYCYHFGLFTYKSTNNNVLIIWSIRDKTVYTLKLAHVVTSIKQSPVSKGHIFITMSMKGSYE